MTDEHVTHDDIWLDPYLARRAVLLSGSTLTCTAEATQTIQTILGALRHSDWAAADPGLATQGGAVSTVPNTGATSSTPLTQGTASLRPTHSAGVVTSDGTGDQLAAAFSPAIAAGSRPYLFVVGRKVDAAQPKYLFCLWETTAGGADDVIALSAANSDWTFDRRVTPGGYQNARGGLADTALHVFELGFTAGGLGTLVVDGAARDSIEVEACAATMAGVILHGLQAGDTAYASAFAWQRVILCANEPTAEQKAEIRALLKSKYSVPTYQSESVELFDTSSLVAVFGTPQAFGGAVTDGTYVYFIPANSHAYLLRYNPALDWTDPAAWAYFNMAAIGASVGRQWGTFDGRHVYAAPYPQHDLVRYDTQASFSAGGSYEVKDLTAVDANAYGFTGMVSNGDYVYLVPSHNPLPALGLAVRYNKTLPFSATGSYEKFDMTTVHAKAKGFSLGIYCAGYVYYIPWDAGVAGGDIVGVLVRYNTALPFTSAGSWEAFDMTAAHAQAKGLSGGERATDGQWIYMVPVEQTRGTLNGHVFVRYNTSAAFGSAGSYEVFDVAATFGPRAVGYYEAVYDGSRYVYMIDFAYGMILKYDTTLPFTSASSWSLAVDGQAYKDGAQVARLGGGVIHDGFLYCPNSQNDFALKMAV